MWKQLPSAVARCAVALGIIGFLLPLGLGVFPDDWLNAIELPNALGSARVAAPNGRVFVASEPLGRVQRYGPQGFERGFYVGSQGGAFDIGVSDAGDVLICSVRARALIVYTQDGVETARRGPCTFNDANGGLMPASRSYERNARVPEIAFGWFGLLAVSLWHPFIAWFMALMGALFLKSGTARSQQSELSSVAK
ncbi:MULTISPECIES: hypothetical protein [unclassified Bradyrhizobium]|uniref:hypothetical protein n=1 Tax=unclassified Bradyrhizobium TaxID=2631580 RepID=UPI0029161E9C|nr:MULTISPECIES: hypothetical protein [unclassified Bradyrhizobium]